jgi:hypothetical protein
MITTVLDKAEGLLSRWFVVAYWMPTFIALVVVMLPRMQLKGLGALLTQWQNLVSGEDASGQLWLTLLLLLTVTMLAYLLQSFTRLIIQVFEGYRLWPTGTYRRRVAHQQQRMAALEATFTSDAGEVPEARRDLAYASLILHYPPKAGEVLPTRLGNALKAAEAYGRETYGMDLPVWWPRLWAILTAEQQAPVQDALAGMINLLNLAGLLVYAGLDNAGYLLIWAPGWQKLWALAYLAGCWGVAWLSYEGAVVQARSYGQQLRAAVDVHRLDLLKALHVTLPKTPLDEAHTWSWLKEWLYDGVTKPIETKRYAHPEEDG